MAKLLSSLSSPPSIKTTTLRLLRGGVVAVWTAMPLAAQGVTGSAITGRVLGVDRIPLEHAIVRVINTSNGERWQTTTNSRGRYFIEYLSVGGPYRIEVRAVGYQPAQRDSILLTLGQRLSADFALPSAVLQLEEIAVIGRADASLNATRTGPAQTISDTAISRLPVPGRDYTELARLSPQVTKSPNGGLSFTGQHDRYNSTQIDGTNNNDPFRRSGSGNGTPGWAVGLTAFTPEAMQELQVVTAPFDVRYGGFAGGLINAVTRSGSNRLEGSILGYLESTDLVGADESGSRGEEFNHKEFGLTLSVPIVREKVAVFLNAALQRQVFPQTIRAPTSDTTGGADSVGVGIRYESLVRFQELLRGYGVEPGGFSPGAFSAPTRNLFVKATAQLGVNSRLVVSHNYGHGNNRFEDGGRGYGLYSLSSTGSENPETINATRLIWTTTFRERFSNQVILARVDDRRVCRPRSNFPAVSVDADAGVVAAGIAGFCLGLETGHTTWQLTDNFGVTLGNHQLTFGARGERIDLVDDVLLFPAGAWRFSSLDSLAQGQASGYNRDILVAADSQVAFAVNQVGVYLQDQWLPTPRLTLTAGFRLDVPFATRPTRHPVALRELGINTSLTPSGNILWSPRLGVNYDASGKGTTVLRGGVGFFAGEPAFIWFRPVYGTTGVRAFTLQCEGEVVPEFTLDPANPPGECADLLPPAPRLAYFNPDFRFPRSLKLAMGADRLLPGGIVGTVDFVYTRMVSSFHLVDVNLHGPVGASAGEGGRVLYGGIDSTGQATPSRRTDALLGVFELGNLSGDRSYSFTTQLGKHFPNGTELSGAYTYTDAKDRMSTSLDLAANNTGSTPVDRTLEHRELRTSLWERPHKITVVGTTNLPLGFRLGLVYIGMSSEPFTYVLLGDPNADGFQPSFLGASNDVVYVPKDAADITLADPAEFAALDHLIRNEPCLRAHRGRLLERNSCRDSWEHATEARLAKEFRLPGSRILEVTADLFDVLNFLDSDWGVVRHTQPLGDGNMVPLMELVGYDAANARGVYRLAEVFRREIDVEASRWRVQLGATLSF